MWRSAAHASNARLRNSLPLSSESRIGSPRLAMIDSSAAMTAVLVTLDATVIVKLSRVQLSITVKQRNSRPD